jgi:sulfite reductase (NADPH) flavoprotein alpha-component
MSFIAPCLPESAPFSSLQRAWIDGFLAGLFGDSGTDAAAASVAPGDDDGAAPPGEPENFPWHDPALSLDERLALAAGRAPERVLMAAMAQTDCGQCGYLCQTYAEAIARGEETRLTRCLPGGKATSRALKELVATSAAPAPSALPAAPAAAAVPVPVPVAAGSFAARLIAARPLNGSGSQKDTRQIVLAAEDSRLAWEVGDSLGVVACNSPDLVSAIIERLQARPETAVLSPDGIERSLGEALARFCEIRRPSDQAVEVMASRAHDIAESRMLLAMAEGYPGAGPEDADLLDLIDSFPSARPPLSELISALDPLQPRLYSIASSPKHAASTFDLTVAAVRYEKRDRQRAGVASSYLCDRVVPGEVVPVFVHPNDGFRLAAPDSPVIMIGPGTGIAPFRAFLQEREATGARGRNWLFFGNPHRHGDFLFEDELTAWHRDGLLTRLDTAFSRDQEHKIYVQHRLLEHARELWAWLQDGAHLYVCGDAERMARDVDRGLAYILAKEGPMEPTAAKAPVANMTLFSIALLAPHPPTVTIGGMGWNLLWVTLGNIVSGAGIMGVGYWAASRTPAPAAVSARLAAAE